MPSASAPDEGRCQVRWLSQHALAELPERVDQSNARQICSQFLTVIDHPVLILMVDMTGTTTCDFACGDALAQVFQWTMTRGIDLRLIAPGDSVRHVLSLCGLDRVVPVYRTVGAALAATAPADVPPASDQAGSTAAVPADPSYPAGGTGVEIALLDAAGVIVWVNSAWQAFTAANGGDPAATGPGVSYLNVCAAAAGDLVTAQVEAAIRLALTGDLPGSFTIEVPCHSPGTARWFDMLISSRLDENGRPAGATITLSLARSHTRELLAASEPGPGEPGRDLISGMADRLTAVSDLLEVTAARAAAPIEDPLRQAVSELAAVIRDARTANPEPDG
jgi:anti-anti-sigma regulatory factor